jgi:O-antigen/teichoic acid export membrane protein
VGVGGDWVFRNGEEANRQMTLRKRTFSAVRWTTIGSAAKALLQVVQVAVLARLLAPEDYGLMAMVTVVLSFAALFSDFGVNSAFLQRRDVSEDQRSSLFWFNVLLSSGLMVLVILLSPLFAWYFGDQRVGPLMMLSAITFVIAALGIQVRMAAEKVLQFRPVVVIEVVAALFGFAVAITGALLGWGVYALVIGSIAAAFATTLLLWGFLAQGWRPTMRLRFAEVRSFLGFGSALVANNLVNQINLTIDLLLGGRLLTAAQLGLYSIPRQLVLQVQFVVNPIITRVAFPLIAEVQNDISRVRSIYLQTLNMTASTNAPIYVGAFFFAPEIVHLVLGEGWEESAVLLQALALWGGLRSTGNPVGSLLLGMGRADLSLKWNLGLLMIVPPVVWFGSTFGPQGLAWSLFGLSIALFIPGWFVLIRPVCKATLVETMVASLRPFLIAGIAIGVSYIASSDVDGSLMRLLLGVLVSAPLYLGLSYLMNRSWVDSMRELIGHRH